MKSSIIAIAAVTMDGKIARNAGHFTDWTSPEDKTFMRGFLDTCDVVVVGNNTYKTAETPLSKRNCIVFTRAVKNTERQRDNLLLCNPEVASVKTVLEPYQRIALLGGAQTYTYFLEQDLIDEIYLTIEPIVFGSGLDLLESKNEIATKFEFVSFKALNKQGTVLLHYRRPS